MTRLMDWLCPAFLARGVHIRVLCGPQAHSGEQRLVLAVVRAFVPAPPELATELAPGHGQHGAGQARLLLDPAGPELIHVFAKSQIVQGWLRPNVSAPTRSPPAPGGRHRLLV